jgi:hypothetical protein
MKLLPFLYWYTGKGQNTTYNIISIKVYFFFVMSPTVLNMPYLYGRI